MSTKQITREELSKLATITISRQDDIEDPEQDADAETYAWIREQLRRGNEWAWCCIEVTATYDGITASDCLSGCSYVSEADFRRPGGYYDDMVHNALDDLCKKLEARTPVGRAKSLASDCRQAITTQAAHAIVRGVTTYDMEITASCDAKLIVVEWDDALDVPANHAAAALQLFELLGWNERNELVMGSTSTGFVFVQVPKQAAKS